MSAIARTLGVSRSNLVERASKPAKPRGPYRKADDVVVLAELRPIIEPAPDLWLSPCDSVAQPAAA